MGYVWDYASLYDIIKHTVHDSRRTAKYSLPSAQSLLRQIATRKPSYPRTLLDLSLFVPHQDLSSGEHRQRGASATTGLRRCLRRTFKANYMRVLI